MLFAGEPHLFLPLPHPLTHQLPPFSPLHRATTTTNRDAAERLPAALDALRRRVAVDPTIARQQRRQKQQQQQLKSDADADADTVPTAAAWAQDSARLTAAVREMSAAGSELASVYQQELSVWAAEDDGSVGGGDGGSGGDGGGSGCDGSGGRDLGATAANALAGYHDLSSVIDAVGLIMDSHNTLQDVPSEWLADLVKDQAEAAAELAEAAAVLAHSATAEPSAAGTSSGGGGGCF